MAKKQITNEELAQIIKAGFDETGSDIKGVKKDIKELKRDMDEIKLKFAYTAWQIDVKELQERVAVLEKKNGIRR